MEVKKRINRAILPLAPFIPQRQSSVCGRLTFNKSCLPAASLLFEIQAYFKLKFMVKFKEGYVMNAREKAEFDRVNALSRKTSGRIDFYYKPQTKYPPRIYLFMHAEHGATVTAGRWGFSTPDDQKEIEYHHFNIRLCYLRRLE